MASNENRTNFRYSVLTTTSLLNVGVVLIVLTYLSNVILLITIYRAKSTRKIKNDCYGYYLVNLCIAGIIAATLCVLSNVTFSSAEICNNYSVHLRVLCGLHTMFTSISIQTTALMIMERFLVVNNPIRKRKTLCHVKRRIYAVWIWAFVNASPEIFLHRYASADMHLYCDSIHYTVKFMKLYLSFLLISILFIPTGIIFFSSVGLLLAYSSESALSLKRRKRQRRFVFFIFSAWITFVCSSMPKYILQVIISFDEHKFHESKYLDIFIIALYLSWSNHLLLPIVYLSIYGKILKPELMIIRENDIIRLTHLYQVIHSPIFSSRSSDLNADIDSYFSRIPMINVQDINGSFIDLMTYELNNEDLSGNVSSRSESRNSSFSGDISNAKNVFFKKRGGSKDKMKTEDNQYLNMLAPTYDHVVYRLNQTS